MKDSLLDKARKEINEIDKQMAELFVKRMRAVEDVALYKKENGMAILDSAREDEVIRRNSCLVEDEAVKKYYVKFLKGNMALSRDFQACMIGEGAASEKKLHLDLGEHGYDIHIGRGLLMRAGEIFNLKRRVFILTDSGVPKSYAECVKEQCQDAKIMTLEQGEGSKSADTFKTALECMLEFGMTRTDCVVAVGGGVVGDLAGFVASAYMRGIDFYNIPTTLLSQVDSSVGGKTAINLGGVKNIVGAFYQPRGVIIDPDVLSTLPKRQIANGLAEAIKMSLTSDRELFKLFESQAITEENIEEIIFRSVDIKRKVVEADEREGGLRKILNFGHTLAHGIEAEGNMCGLYHGECVALGMLACSSDKVIERLLPVLRSAGLPTEYNGDVEKALSFISHDKKCDGNLLSVIFVDEPGSYRIEKMELSEFEKIIRERITK